MFGSLRIQLGAIVFCFVLLLAGSIAITYTAVRKQVEEAAIIDLAGRQSMLTQRMAWLAVTQPGSPALSESIRQFDETLALLRDGGERVDASGLAVVISPPPSDALRARLDAVAGAWASYRASLQPAGAAALEAESPVLLDQLDAIVEGYAAQARADATRLHQIQIALFAAALLLLAAGYFITRRRFMRPVLALDAAAGRIAAGQLDQPVPVRGRDEFARLAQSFETMRAEIADARQELETRVAQRTRELATAFELSQEIVAQLDLDHLLQSVTDRARDLMRAEAASLCLLDDRRTQLVLSASSGDGSATAELRQPVWRFPANLVLSDGRTVATDTACSTCGFMRRHAPGHCAAAPLRAGDRTLGALCVVRGAGRPFDSDESRALTLLANSAAVAIANARLVAAERRQTQQAATLAERERLAAEFHDHLAQTLGFLNLQADRVRDAQAAGDAEAADSELARMKQAIAGAYRQVRAALVGLSDPAPGGDDLAGKLSACLVEFQQSSGLLADLAILDPSALQLTRAAQNQAILIVREALANVRKHARARRVWLRVERDRDEARFSVEDDGRGFDPLAAGGDHHLGLAIMHTRAERSGGYLTVDSAPGAGSRVTLHYSLAAAPVAAGALTPSA